LAGPGRLLVNPVDVLQWGDAQYLAGDIKFVEQAGPRFCPIRSFRTWVDAECRASGY
jgi:hypothetical protein